MKKALLVLTVLCVVGRVSAQGLAPGATGPPSPDCYASGYFTATGTGFGGNNGANAVFSNIGIGCTSWHMTYTAGSSVSALSIELDAAPVGPTQGSAGAFVAMTGVAFGSANPSTVVVGGDIAMAPIVTPAYVQVKVGTFTGSGVINYVVMGYRPGVSSTPGAGFGTIAVTAVSSGFPVLLNACDHSALISQAASTTVLVTHVTGQSVHVCSIALTATTAGTVQFLAGTGATCGSTQTVLSGAITLALGTPFTTGSGTGQILQPLLNQDYCLVSSVAAAGFISYTIY